MKSIINVRKSRLGLVALFVLIFMVAMMAFVFGFSFRRNLLTADASTGICTTELHQKTKIYSSRYSSDYYMGCEDYADYAYDVPSITVLMHGFNGSAYSWSNKDGSFAYNSTSLISKIGKKLNNVYDLYVAITKDEKFLLHKLNTTDYSNYNNEQTYTDHITAADKHIVIVYESAKKRDSNQVVYNEFDQFLDTISMQFRDLTGKLPIYNLVGHSRGGLTNLEYATNHPYNVATLCSMGTPYSGSTLSSIDYIVEMIYKKDGNGQWQDPGINSILSIDESIRLRDGWNSMKKEYEDSPVKAVAIGTTASIDFVRAFVQDLRDTDYIDNQDTLIDILDSVLQVVQDYPSFSNNVLNTVNGIATVLKWFNYDVYSDLTKANVTYEEAQEILGLVEMINGEIVIMDDLFIDLNSQLANGYKFQDQIEYTGFDRRLKTFTAEDFNGGRSTTASAAVHNLECMNDELTSFIAETLVNGSYEEQITELKDFGVGTITSKSVNTFSFYPEYTGSRDLSVAGATMSLYEIENGLWKLTMQGSNEVTYAFEQGKEYRIVIHYDNLSDGQYQFTLADDLGLTTNSISLDANESHIYSFTAPSSNFYVFSCDASNMVDMRLASNEKHYIFLNKSKQCGIILRNTSSSSISFSLDVLMPNIVELESELNLSTELNAVEFSNTFGTKCEYQIEINSGNLSIFDSNGDPLNNSCTVTSNTKTYYFTLEEAEKCYMFFEGIVGNTSSKIMLSKRQFSWMIDGEIMEGQDVTFRSREPHRIDLCSIIGDEVIRTNTPLSIKGGLTYRFDTSSRIITITEDTNTDATLYITPEIAWDYSMEIHLEPKYTISFKNGGITVEEKKIYVGDTISLPSISKTNYNGVWKIDGTNQIYNFGSQYTLSDKGNLKFIAQWTGMMYSIEYRNLTSPTGLRAECHSDTQYEYGKGVVLSEPYFIGNNPNQISKDWRFVGWYNSDSYTNRFTVVSSSTSGHLVFYAKWEWNACSKEGYFSGNGAIIGNDFNSNTTVYAFTWFEDYSVAEINKMGFTKATITFSFTYQEKSDGYQRVQILNSSGTNLSGVREFEAPSGVTKTETFSFDVDLKNIAGQNQIIIQFGARGWFNNDWYLKKYELQLLYS